MSSFISILLLIPCFLLGVYVGRSSLSITEKTEYKQGETFTGYLSGGRLVPKGEEKSTYTDWLPLRTVTIQQTDTIIILQQADTAAIITDYLKERAYAITLFDNPEHGRLNLFPTLQYNRLASLGYEYTPVYKQTTLYKERRWQPFVGASYSTLNYVSIGGGMFRHHVGFELNYITDFQRKGLEIGLKYKF